MATNIIVPELGESVVEATVARWLKQEGDAVSVGEPLVELETEKIDLEVGATRSGVLARITRRDGEDVKIGEVLGVIEDAAGHVPGVEPAASPGGAVPSPAPQQAVSKSRATATARRLAEEHGIDPSAVRGSGDGGRVTRQDVERHIQAGATVPATTAGPTPARVAVGRDAGESARPPALAPGARPTPTGERALLEERVRMSRRRQTIARRLVEAQRTAAMLTTFNEVDMSAVMELRRRHKESFRARHGVTLGIASFFVKASVAALRAFPRLNAEIQGDDMVLKRYYDIGVAVGAAEGLVVPVLRDADRLSFADIERGIKEFARKANEGGLTLEDLKGGTFTITNGGVFGSLLSTPILNPPQVGILGLHKIEDRVVPSNGQVAVRPMMYLALSYDHRIVDGLEAVQFLVRVKEIVEDPPSLLLA